MSRKLNLIAYETGHPYWECPYCESKDVEVCGYVNYCYDCIDYIPARLKGDKQMSRVYYIECKINGIQEKFRFEDKKALEDYLDDKGQVLRCGNVTDLDCYSEEEK